MIRYFCECCGKEMDNASSRQIRFMMKNRENREELKNDEYSLCDDSFNICEDCSIRIMNFIEMDKEQSTPPVLEDEEWDEEEYDDEGVPYKPFLLTLCDMGKAFVSGFRDNCRS